MLLVLSTKSDPYSWMVKIDEDMHVFQNET